MKTLIDVKMEIQRLRDDATFLHPKVDKSKINKIKKRIAWLQLAANYLDSVHAPEYTKQAIIMAKNKLERLMELTPAELDRADKNPEMKKKVVMWDKKEGVDRLRGQIKFMQYLNS